MIPVCLCLHIFAMIFIKGESNWRKFVRHKETKEWDNNEKGEKERDMSI